MAVLAMQRITICALKRNRKSILEFLQRKGIVEITETADIDDSVFSTIDTLTSQDLFEKNIAAADKALDVLQELCPEKHPMSKLDGRRNISLQQYNEGVKKRDETAKISLRIVALAKEISDLKSDITRLQTQLEALTPWLLLDVPMRFKGTATTSAFIGTFPEPLTREVLISSLSEKLPDISAIDAEIISSASQQTCVFILCMKQNSDEVESALRSLGFAYAATPSKTPPSERKNILEQRIKKREDSIAKRQQEIVSYAPFRNDLRFLSDYYTMRTEKYRVLSQLLQSRHTFMATGYIAERDAQNLRQELSEKYNAYSEIEDLSPDEVPPVILKNNLFARPVEPVLESYSLPGKGEIDPSTVMAVFYYLLFGMMLSDAAYGIIMILGCAIALFRHKNMESGLKKTLQMFLYCGVSTTFWGIMFGSYFGDAVTVISSTFFKKTVSIAPVWFVPVDEPMRLLVFCFLLGVIHLFTGLAVQFYQLCRAGKFKDAIYDVVFWYMLVGGGIVYLLSLKMFSEMMSLSFTLSSQTGKIAGWIAIAGAVGIVATAGRDSQNFFKRILKGLYGLYNVSGYLSDILSYSRLLALGLATGVIASVFNKMGSMAGSGPIGVITFILVFLVGHTLNIAINLLGAYVHTNRLQYVEFFGKFYEGGGQKFRPFTSNTKYYKIKEDN